MIPVPSGVRVWLAVGHTDMRRGMNSLAIQVQEGLGRDPHAGDLYVFRGRAEIVRHSASFAQKLGSQRVLSSWKRV
jgi:transposase